MPRVFLVKKTSSTSGKRNWNEVPDCARGDVYTPGECLYGFYCFQSKDCHVNDFYSLWLHVHGFKTGHVR